MRGSIKQRSRGSWTLILSQRVNGKLSQKWQTVKGTRREAEKKLAELIHEVDSGTYVKPSKLTTGQYLDQWLTDYATNNVRLRTLEGYTDIIEGHLKPGIGEFPLDQLNGDHLQAYYATKLKKGRRDGKGGLSASSVLHHHRLIHKVLNTAVKRRVLQRNVAMTADPPRPEKTEMTSLDEDGLDRLLETARETMYYPFLHLAAYTGMRRSELLGLRWQHVDLNLASLSVVQVMHRVRGAGFVFQPPKTAKSRRAVALSPTAVLALKAHREQQEALWATLGTPASDLVFCHPDGSPLRPDTVTHAFADLVKRSGLPHVRLHDLRHTHASLMMEQGVNPKIVSERLGHASVGITLDTYSHVTPGMQAAAALEFDRRLAQRKMAEAIGD